MYDFEFGPGFTSERLGDFYVVQEEQHLLDVPDTNHRGGHLPFGYGWPDDEGILFLVENIRRDPDARRSFIATNLAGSKGKKK